MKRKLAKSEYKWDFSNLYENNDKWLEDLESAKKIIKKIATLKGQLAKKESFINYLKLDEQVDIKLSKLSQYLHYADLDTTNIEYQKLSTIYGNELNVLMPSISFVSNEIKKIGEKIIMTWLNSDKNLVKYIYSFKVFFKNCQYVLESNEEELLAKVEQSRTDIFALYDMLAFADRKPVFINYNGKEQELTTTLYNDIIENSDPLNQQLRIEATKKFSYNLIDNKHTFAKIYESIIQYSFESVKLRKYDSCLQKFLNGDNVDPKIYERLIEIGKKYSYLFKDYCNIIKKHFKLKKMYATDRNLKLVKTTNKKYSVEEAKEIIRNAVKPLGSEYLQLLEIGWSANKIDYFEDVNKRTGAYSSGGNGMEPIILMNWDDTIGSINTLAHEIGHSVHTLFADKYQPMPLANYPIILAEVASTVNEHLLFDYLYTHSKDKNEKIYLLQTRILEIMNTFFRQIHFANFELSAHQMVEKNIPLNSENLADLFSSISDEFGYTVFDKLEKPYSWPRISHFFHSPFYVYKYATCIVASFKLFNDIKNGNPDNLINFMKAGGKKYPLDILKDIGIDYNDEKIYLDLIEMLSSMVKELNNLLN